MKSKSFLILFAIIAILIFCYYPLFTKGFFPTDDGEKLIIRWASFHQALRDNQLPPRWAGNLFHGFGYPVFIFLYPGLLFLWEFLYLATNLPFLIIIKIFLISSFLFSSIFMFAFLKQFFGDLESFTGSIIYSLAPYRFFDVYERGSFGEVLCFVVAPIVFWAISRFFKTKKIKWFLTGIFGWAYLLISHNVSAILFSIIIIIFVLINALKTKKRTYLYYSALFVLLSFLLSSFFLIPAFFERKYTHFYQIKTAITNNYFLSLKEFLITSNYFGFFYIPLIIFAIVIIFRKNKYKTFNIFFSAVFLISLFFVFQPSGIFWKIFNMEKYVQFPFRFLSLTVFAGSFIAASFISNVKQKLFLSIFIILLAIVSSFTYAKPNFFFQRNNDWYLTNLDSTTSADEYLPIWVKEKPIKLPDEKIEVDGKYKIIRQESNYLEFDIDLAKEQQVKVNTFYYPGWKLFVNGKEEKIDYENNKGLIAFRAGPGEANIRLVFNKTPLRLFSDIISLLSLVICLLLVVILNRQKA